MRALPQERKNHFSRFIGDYSRVRSAEGRGSTDPAWYLSLPYDDLTGRHASQWAIRGRSYRFFETNILPKLEKYLPLQILDLGAGNGWLSYRLALRNHVPVAVDLVTDGMDGLGAARHYFEKLGRSFPRFEAEFDRLPFAGGQFDLAIFNSSLHYSTDYPQTLSEARRCLKPEGSVVILDSPIYRRKEIGERMPSERHEFFRKTYGFPSDSIPSIEFLDDKLLRELQAELGICWEIHRPWYGWKWWARPIKATLLRHRPPSRFHILLGSWPAS